MRRLLPTGRSSVPPFAIAFIIFWHTLFARREHAGDICGLGPRLCNHCPCIPRSRLLQAEQRLESGPLRFPQPATSRGLVRPMLVVLEQRTPHNSMHRGGTTEVERPRLRRQLMLPSVNIQIAIAFDPVHVSSLGRRV